MTQKESIISRIRKLLNLTIERGATPDEAATAAAKVQALLTEYNLEMADVAQQETVNEIGTDTQTVSNGNRSPYTKPFANLLYILSKYNFCQSIYNNDGRSVIFGKPHNIAAVKYLYSHLSRVLLAEAKRQYKEQSRLETPQSWNTSFIQGANYEIALRLKAQQEQQSQTSGAVNALVVTSNQLVQQRVRQEFPRIENLSFNISSSLAREAGQQFGRTVALNQGVTQSATQHAQIGG